MSHERADLGARVAAAIARLGRTDPKVLALRARWADALLGRGLEDEGFAELDALVVDAEAALGPRHETTLVLANNRAMKLAERSRPEGLEQLAALVPVATEVFGPRDRRTVLVRSNLAAATGMAGRFGEAIARIEALLAERDDLDDEVVATLRSNLASWRERNGS
ncbi:hypothetical protein [Paraliomyxa miuraensis]|uniref:hypothetical protein n=1 Tax=Paraliomyxa miuraensis TaxID=376150 RepID=UPI0022585F4B|nr:hypothetical protein [Paraliomyxa miuraensis]MCX4245104.1 hypothetical protein [Paraliomyxa miuraensis]